MTQSSRSTPDPTPEAAYKHLSEAVGRRGLTVSVVPDCYITGYLAQINMATRSVEVAESVVEDLELLVMVLAHELAHAYDPEYRITWSSEYQSTIHAEAERELVAQTAANEFCSLYLIDFSRTSELYVNDFGIPMTRLLRLRVDVALCSMLPKTPRVRRFLADAHRRWRYRWIPFVARRPLPKHIPLLQYGRDEASS